MSWVNPVAGRISSKFGNRKHPITGKVSLHGGTDIAAASGAAVKVASAGTVAVVSYNSLAGYFINVEHAGGVLTRYHHLSVQSVKVGDKVKAGQIIGKVGATGSATGPHLHFEVHQRGTKVNPQTFMRGKYINLGTDKPLPKPTPTPKPTGGIDVSQLPIIRPGDRGVHVGIMQGALVARGYSVGKTGVDNSNGNATQKAVNAYQKKNPATGTNGKPDNTCGRKMWASLLGL